MNTADPRIPVRNMLRVYTELFKAAGKANMRDGFYSRHQAPEHVTGDIEHALKFLCLEVLNIGKQEVEESYKRIRGKKRLNNKGGR